MRLCKQPLLNNFQYGKPASQPFGPCVHRSQKEREETEWITSADDHNIKTGIAFVPCDTFTPVSLLYTMIERPETLVIDVLLPPRFLKTAVWKSALSSAN